MGTKLINLDGHNLVIDSKSGKLTHTTFDTLSFENEVITGTNNAHKIIDMKGKTLLPGFSDSHVHFFQTGFLYAGGDMSSITSEQELFETIHKLIQDKQTLQCWGYDPKDQLPSKTQLDVISDTKPIFLRRRDGHSSVINTPALKLIHNSISKYPEEFDIGSGFLRSDAHIEAERIFLNMASREDLEKSKKDVQEQAIKKGITAIHSLIHRLDWAKIIVESENLLDLPIYLESWNVPDAIELSLPRIGGCLLLDGAFGSHTAALLEPYADKTSSGFLYQKDKDLRNFVQKALMENMQTSVHCIGDKAVSQIVNIHKQFAKKFDYPKLRARLEHAELVPDNLFDTIRELGIILSIQPTFEYFWGGPKGLYNDRLGSRHTMTNRFRSLREHGIILTGGSDSYITPIDPLLGIHSAVNHPNRAQRLPVSEAIAMFTHAPRIATHTEDHVGTLDIGKDATFVVLKDNPWENPETIKNIEVLETWIKGTKYHG